MDKNNAGLLVSVVIPCLNEEQTVGICVEKAINSLKKIGVKGEVLVVDNGSTDNSVKLAEEKGARVILEKRRGYGYAYLRGFEEAAGKYIVMGDADDTYDFSQVDKFIKPLEQGYDFVLGSRFKGTILPRSMPWTHRYVGNPILTGILQFLFKTKLSDAHCGMRAFTRESFFRMELQTTGMELASEMIINALRKKLKIYEVPIVYYPRKGVSKLFPFRDAWRHMRFMLLFSPTYLFIIPGFLLLLPGLFFLVALFGGPFYLLGHGFDVHFMVLGSIMCILGFQVVLTGFQARVYALNEGFIDDDRLLHFFFKNLKLEKGIAIGAFFFVLGFIFCLYMLLKWIVNGFGPLDEVRTGLIALTFMILGAQTIFGSFFFSILGLKRKR